VSKQEEFSTEEKKVKNTERKRCQQDYVEDKTKKKHKRNLYLLMV
jgi:hypothetical protein